MIEVALAQVEARCARGGQHHIAGFYHANRSMKDSSQVKIILKQARSTAQYRDPRDTLVPNNIPYFLHFRSTYFPSE